MHTAVTTDFTCAEHFLRSLDADWAAHIDRIGPCRHMPHPACEPYQALIRAVAHQQLHAKAGDAILGRLQTLYPGSAFPSPAQLQDTPAETLRRCGFSAGKVLTLQGIAQAALDGRVPNRRTALGMDDESLVQQLIPLRGIGRWSVEMLLIYSLERMDILPADDFGVRAGYQRLKNLAALPTRKQIAGIGLAWSPYRTVASWYLWRMPAQ